MTDKLTIHFLGASGTVTGSKFLIEACGKKIMVDCGLFQGIKKLRLLNWEYLPVDVPNVDLVLLTHGHLDHTGFLPRLIKMGFNGKIMGTHPTLDIAQIILEDSAKIQEEEAEKANKMGYTKHHPARPLYDSEDVVNTVSRFYPVKEGDWNEFTEDIRYRYFYNGHILGSCYIELEIKGKTLVFSGDVGRPQDMLLNAPKKPKKADFLFVESTYGGRLHPEENVEEILERTLTDAISHSGTIIIPSFAVERTQMLMLVIWRLQQQGKIPEIPVIMDSPMGRNVLTVFKSTLGLHKLTAQECDAICNKIRIVQSFSETMELIADKQAKIVIAGSGMVSGGRVLTWLQHYIGRPETTLLLAGFQAEGTRGRMLLEGASEIKLYGEYYPVHASVLNIQGLSAHGDQKELLDWLSEIENTPEQVFIIHGEAHSSDVFRVKINDTYGWEAQIPELYQISEFDLE